MKAWHNRGFDGTATVEANMRQFGYLAKVLFQPEHHVTAIWEANIVPTAADTGQIQITASPGDTVSVYWNEVSLFDCGSVCQGPATPISVRVKAVYKISIKYTHFPSSYQPGFKMTWTGATPLLDAVHCCPYNVSPPVNVFSLSQFAESLTTSQFAYFQPATNQYITTNIQLTAGSSNLFVVLLRY